MPVHDIQVNSDRKIGLNHPPFIIAEIGNNHNGKMDLAIQLVKAAAAANADAIKLQTKNPETAFRKELLDMPYLNENSFGATYREHKYAIELTQDETAELYTLADSLGLIAFSTPFDVDSVDMLEKIGQPIYKISSFHVTDLKLIEKVCKTGKPVIMSTGMSSWEEIDKAVEVIRRFTEDFILMQCTSSYPAGLEDLNLAAIPAIQERYQCQVGYSGHERGVGVGPGAVLLGAAVIERHFTMDRTLKGPDHAASLEPRGLDLLVKRSNNYWKALGTPKKEIQESELANRLKFRGY
ncbi:MAG: N-acetylneuraminate synthase family protein [Chloroflexota bacterium]|nr:N-acetylneuraminate synthase family protein [Chloroflexota bacterium]